MFVGPVNNARDPQTMPFQTNVWTSKVLVGASGSRAQYTGPFVPHVKPTFGIKKEKEKKEKEKEETWKSKTLT